MCRTKCPNICFQLHHLNSLHMRKTAHIQVTELSVFNMHCINVDIFHEECMNLFHLWLAEIDQNFLFRRLNWRNITWSWQKWSAGLLLNLVTDCWHVLQCDADPLFIEFVQHRDWKLANKDGFLKCSFLKSDCSVFLPGSVAEKRLLCPLILPEILKMWYQ